MLKDSIDFEYAIKKVTEELDTALTLQEALLDSEIMNTNLDKIETSLNKLYENTRYLEDAIDYCKTFLALKIDDYTNEIQSTLKAIEDIRDINKNTAYMEHPVVLKECKTSVTDRDGKEISSCLLKNDKLIIGNKSEETINFKNCIRISDSIPYDENLGQIKTEPYRAVYIEEKIANNGLKESITITFQSPIEMNFLDIKAVNCDIKNLRYVYVNGLEDYIDYTTGITPNKMVASIKFDLVCSRYNISTYSLDKNKITDNVWNKIKEYEYNYVTGTNSKMDAEAVISRVTKKYNSEEKDEEIFVSEIPKKEDIVEKTMYTYMFGIDSISIKKIEQQNESAFVSDLIDIGTLNEDEYIQICVDQYDGENTGIEYSIYDGDVEVPLLPLGYDHVENERIFSNLGLRFAQDESTHTTIKKDGTVVDISLEDAQKQFIGRYSADYLPESKYSYTPINSMIRVKATMRKFGKLEATPYINSIKVRKYGGDLLWMEKL